MLSPNEQENLDTYNKISDQWAATHNKSDFWATELKQFKEFLPAGKIIDLGCGFGRDAGWFNKNGYDYLGVDASEKMVRLAKRHNPGLHFELKDLNNLDFPYETFDGFWASCSLLHIPKNKIAGVLDGIYRIIKPGGVGFISLKQGQGEAMENWQDSALRRFFSFYGKDEFETLLKQTNFSVLSTGQHEASIKEDRHLTFFVKK